jgi:hypothetical protein
MDTANVSGTTIIDIAGSLNGTAHGGVTDGVYERNLDGTGYISLASSPIANFAAAHSVFVWVKLTTPTASGGLGGSATWINFATDASNGLRFANNEGVVDGFVASSFVVSLLVGGVNKGVQTNIVSDAILKAGLPVLIGYTYDGTTIVSYRGTDVAPTAAQTSYGVQNANNIGARASDTTGSVTGAIGRVVTANVAWTAAEVAQLQAAGLAGIPSRKRTAKMTIAGASNTVANSFVEYSLTSLQVGLMDHNNISVGGQVLSQYDTNFVTLLQPAFDSTFDLNLLVIQCTNDMDANGLTGVQAAALAVSISNKWKALGASGKVLLVNAWDFGGGSAFIQVHADFNAAVLGNAAFDAIVDTWQIANLNTGTTALSTTYSADNNHLTKAGHQLVVPYLVAGINSIWSS